MDHQQVLKELIQTLSYYRKKQSLFMELFEENPVLSKVIEVFDEEMDTMIYLVFDQMGIPEEVEVNKYGRKNWKRNVCFHLIQQAASNEKYVEPAVELICDWEKLTE